MHNKRALGSPALSRESAAARLLSQQWRGLHSAAVLETPGKQGNNAPHEPHLDGISRIWGCAHANKLSPSSLRPLPHLCHPRRLAPGSTASFSHSPPSFCLRSTLYREFRNCESHAFGAQIFRAPYKKNHRVACLKHSSETNAE